MYYILRWIRMELSMVGAHIVERTEQHNNEIVNALLKEFGLNDKNIGFKYICDIISLGVSAIDVDNFEWDIYDHIANKYVQNYKAIEINIRRAILLAWDKNSNRLSSLLSLDKNKRPSNKSFMSAVSELLKRNI